MGSRWPVSSGLGLYLGLYLQVLRYHSLVRMAQGPGTGVTGVGLKSRRAVDLRTCSFVAAHRGAAGRRVPLVGAACRVTPGPLGRVSAPGRVAASRRPRPRARAVEIAGAITRERRVEEGVVGAAP